jgi:CheY-like chemotaxis protein
VDRLRSKRVLIVDDDAETRELLCIKLKDALWQTDFARHGHEALRMYMQALSDGRPYDLIVLDVSMPEMSGFKVLEDIRATGDRTTHAVLNTAYSPEPILNVRASMLRADDIWFKPESVVNARELIAQQLILTDNTYPQLPGVAAYPTNAGEDKE